MSAQLSLELITEAFDHLDFGVILFEPRFNENQEIEDLIFSYVNRKTSELNNFSKEELIGAGLVELMPGNKELGLFDRYVKVFETGEPLDFVQEYGRERLEPTIFSIKAKKVGEMLMVYFNDISSSVLTQRKLKDQKDFYEMVFDFSKDAIFIVEVCEDGKFRYVKTNLTHQENSGIPLSAVQGKTPEELAGKEKGKKIIDYYLKAIQSKSGITYENTQEFPAGTITYSAKLNPVRDSEGNVRYLVGIARDITERKKIEDALVKVNADLKITSNQKDKLFSIIAHDMRGPISTSQSLVDLLLESFDALNKAQIKPYLKLISEGLTQTNATMEDLLNWAKSQMGGIVVKRDKIFVNSQLDYVADMLKSQVKAKQLSLNLIMNEDVIAKSDPQLLQIILRNLLNNAVKFTRKGGEIDLILQVNEKHFTIEVRDNGVGISPEKMKMLFSNDFKVDYGTEGEKGTGLGLQIVYDFVKKLKGEISVLSELGKGTTFTLKFPLK